MYLQLKPLKQRTRIGQSILRHCFSVYATGDGWTGALGTGSLDSLVVGHDDEEDADVPVLLYSGETTAISAGWGHTALIGEDNDRTKLMVCGRPHDFQALLRLKRLPGFIRGPAVNHSFRTIRRDVNKTSSSFFAIFFDFLLAVDENRDSNDDWKVAMKNSISPILQHIELPGGDMPCKSARGRVLDTSAGLTAVIGDSGILYTFGINNHGQCGIGKVSNNVWSPQAVMGLNTSTIEEGRDSLQQENSIVSVALGLQHGIALDEQGNVYTWGKDERGQLGTGIRNDQTKSESAVHVKEFRLESQDGRIRVISDVKVARIDAGMNHSAALTEDNQVFIWGKNISPASHLDKAKIASDCPTPRVLQGLPEGLKVLEIACGSHHTAILMEDGSVFAAGITTDNKEPIFDAVELLPPGVVNLPCRQFDAHFDRTTIVGKDGTQVLQFHLWSEEEYQENAIFTPSWIDALLDDNENNRVRSIQRGWLHSLVSTDLA